MKKLRPRKCPDCEYKKNRNLICLRKIHYTNHLEQLIGFQTDWKCSRCGYENTITNGDLEGNKKIIYIKY